MYIIEEMNIDLKLGLKMLPTAEELIDSYGLT